MMFFLLMIPTLAGVAILVFFLLQSGDLFKRKIVKIAGPTLSRKKITVEILDEINRQIGGFLFVRAVSSLVVAIVTWLALRGKCKNCGAPISVRYFLVELLTGLAFLGCWLGFGQRSAALALVYILIGGRLRRTKFEHTIIQKYHTALTATAFLLLGLASVGGFVTSFSTEVWAGVIAMTLASFDLTICALLFQKSRYTLLAAGLVIVPVSIATSEWLQTRNLSAGPWIAWITFAWAGLAEVAIGSAGLAVAYRTRGCRIRAWRFRPAMAGELMRDSWPMVFSSVVTMIYLRIDQVMLGETRIERVLEVSAAHFVLAVCVGEQSARERDRCPHRIGSAGVSERLQLLAGRRLPDVDDVDEEASIWCKRLPVVPRHP